MAQGEPSLSAARRLVDEQAVLRRVAALVGRVARPEELFAAVVGEVGRVLDVDYVILSRHEPEATQVSVGAWSRSAGAVPFPVGTRVRLGGHDVVSLVMRTGRPARIDDYRQAGGEVAEAARRWGMGAAAGVPISVAGRLWGVMAVGTATKERLRPDTEERLVGFTELIAAAVANADARSELQTQAEEQAALRRVATLMTSGVPPEDVFATVAEEVGRLLAVDASALIRFDPDKSVTVVGAWTSTGAEPPTPVGSRLPLGGRNVTTIVFETGEPARLEYDGVSGAIGEVASHRWRLRLSLGVPIQVEGRLWGVMVVAFAREGVLPGDAEARLAAFTQLVATAIANAQAREDLQQVVEEQVALRRVATLVAQGKPPAEIFAVVSREVGRLFGSDHAAVAKFDPDGRSLLVVGVAREMQEVPLGARYELEEGMAAAAVYRTGRSARVEAADWSGAARISQLARRLGTLSSVASPITVDDRLWGTIVVTAPESLPTNTAVRLERFTQLVATAIANTEAREDLHQLVDEQAALRRVATLVASAAAPEELFAAVTAEVGLVVGADTTSLSRYDSEDTYTRVGSWSRTDGPSLQVGARSALTPRNVATLVYRTSRPARVDDPGDASDPATQLARSLGIRSMVAAPISVEDRLWGVMTVGSRREEPLPHETEARLAGFTELVATAIANAQARSELRGFADEQAALRRVATLVARSGAPAEVFAAVTAEIGALLGVDVTSLSRYDHDGMRTRVGTWSRSGVASLPVGVRVSLDGNDVAALAYRTSRPARLDGAGDVSGPLGNLARALEIRSSVAVPINVGGRLWGAMIVASQQERPLPPDTEARLADFTALVGTAIANADAQTALAASRTRVVAAADAARRKVERDLHDGAQQRLVSLILNLRGAVRDAVPPGADGLAEQLDEVAVELQDVHRELRELARGLHPAALADGGLPPALRTLARRSAIPVRLEIEIGGRLPEPIELAAYYVVSETLTNVTKHADATVVRVTASADHEHLRVVIADDGRGGAEPGGGSGLVGLSDRVEALGGALAVTSPSGVGTTVEAVLPLALSVDGSPS